MADTASRELNFPNHIYYATETHFRTVRPIDESMKWFYHNAVGGVDLIPVFFDGGDFLQRLDELTDAVDTTLISGCVAFNTEAVSQVIVNSPDNKIIIEVLASGSLSLTLADAGGVVLYKAVTTATVNDGLDHVFLFFYDGILGKGEMYLDDVPDENVSVETTGTVDLTTTNFIIAAADTDT